MVARSKLIVFDELRELPIEKILALTSEEALSAYKKELYTFEKLKKLPVDEIKKLTSAQTLNTREENRVIESQPSLLKTPPKEEEISENLRPML